MDITSDDDMVEHVADVWLVATKREDGKLVRMHATTTRRNHEVRLPHHLRGPAMVLSVHCSCGIDDTSKVLVMGMMDVVV